MFAISWLDLRRLPVRIDSVGLDAQYVSATIDTDGVMLWFILDESGLHLRCRYPDTVEARANVGGWLDLLVARLQADARSSVRGLLRVAGRTFRLERASRDDVEAIAALLSDDQFGPDRECVELERYEAAYNLVVRDRSNYLGVVRNDADRIVATMQLTVIPGLSRVVLPACRSRDCGLLPRNVHKAWAPRCLSGHTILGVRAGRNWHK
nr:hypothetical protein [Arthrobacter sp. Hiyo1]